MSAPDITRMLVKIPPPTSLAGTKLRAEEVRCVDISIIRTLDAHRAAEIQHDLKLLRERNMNIYNKLKSESKYYFPLVEDIATPIYLITRINGDNGEIVYVGKAQSTTNRFVGGHIALLKLLDPNYKEYDKFISFAILNVRTVNGEMFPVEWVEDKELRDDIIKHVEQALVWKLQPDYNTHYKSVEPKDYAFEMNLYDHDGSNVILNSIRIRVANRPIHQCSPEVRRSAA